MRAPPSRVFIMAYAQCDELDVIGPFAVLQTANRYLSGNGGESAPRGATIDLRIVAARGSGAVTYRDDAGREHAFVTGIHGATMEVEQWDGTDLPDILIVAGGDVDPGTGIDAQADNAAFVAPIRAQLARHAHVVSVCTAAYGLAKAGLVPGRTLTTHPGVLDMVAPLLAPSNGRVLNPDWDARVVDDGDLISCGGVTAGIDEALYLVQTFWPGDPQLVSDVRAFIDFLYRSPVAVTAGGTRSP